MRTNKYLEAIQDYVSSKDTSKALQYGKPGPKDPRKTPAPKKDQKKDQRKMIQIVPKTIKEI